MFRPRSDQTTDARWLDVTNAAGETIPAFAIMRITGFASGAFTVAKPNADDMDPAVLIVNGPAPIDSGKSGVGTQDGPMTCYYDTGDGTPAFDEKWGSGNGSWKLRKDKTGFLILGGAASGYVVATNRYRSLVNVECDGSDILGDYTN